MVKENPRKGACFQISRCLDRRASQQLEHTSPTYYCIILSISIPGGMELLNLLLCQ
jgi:hypothetical protein